jgi:two-component system cell cycle response regulator DivK
MTASLSIFPASFQPVPMTRMSDAGDLFARGWSELAERNPPLILIIDDHDDSRSIGRLLLENAGFSVLEAATGTEGIRAAVEHQPNVVLLDLILPEMDGWSVARHLREHVATRHAMILAVTALAGDDDQDRALLAGCDEILTKPVPPSVLLAAVRRYVACVPVVARRDS